MTALLAIAVGLMFVAILAASVQLAIAATVLALGAGLVRSL